MDILSLRRTTRDWPMVGEKEKEGRQQRGIPALSSLYCWCWQYTLPFIVRLVSHLANASSLLISRNALWLLPPSGGGLEGSEFVLLSNFYWLSRRFWNLWFCLCFITRNQLPMKEVYFGKFQVHENYALLFKWALSRVPPNGQRFYFGLCGFLFPLSLLQAVQDSCVRPGGTDNASHRRGW